MYELVKVTDSCFYINSPAKIGVILKGSGRVCLIDSGNDKDAGKKIIKLLDANGWTLEAIYNTHSHADHIGGNQLLQSRTGCPVYARGIERGFTEHPILEPSFLYGADPPAELRHKFLMAQGCRVREMTDGSLPADMQAIPLPGHSWDMVGFRTKDDIVFLADCLSSAETLDKYGIVFLADVGAYLKTLETVRGMKAALFIPSHAEPTDDIAPLAGYNIQKTLETAREIVGICECPVSFEAILRELFQRHHLTMSFEQHALTGSTVRSYLTWLAKEGCLKAEISSNTLVWQAIKSPEENAPSGSGGAR